MMRFWLNPQQWAIGAGAAVVFFGAILVFILSREAVRDEGREAVIEEAVVRVISARSVEFSDYTVDWTYRDGEHRFATSMLYHVPAATCSMYARVSLLERGSGEIRTTWLERPERLAPTGDNWRRYEATFTTDRTIEPGDYLMAWAHDGYCETHVQLPALQTVPVKVGAH